MATISTTSPPTLAELVERLGGVPLDRIRCRPALGTATVQDFIDIQFDGGEVLPGFAIKVSDLFPPQRRRTP